jgi:hypothetical protein
MCKVCGHECIGPPYTDQLSPCECDHIEELTHDAVVLGLKDLSAIVGAVMRELDGKANPQTVVRHAIFHTNHSHCERCGHCEEKESCICYSR